MIILGKLRTAKVNEFPISIETANKLHQKIENNSRALAIKSCLRYFPKNNFGCNFEDQKQYQAISVQKMRFLRGLQKISIELMNFMVLIKNIIADFRSHKNSWPSES